MDNVIAWFLDYWPYAVALVVVAVGASFLFRKAARAYRDHQKRFHAEEAQMRRLVELKKTYYPLTEAAIAAAPDEELLEGTALSIQIPLQKQDDPERAFAALPEAQQLIYVLDVFVSDGKAAVFFKESLPFSVLIDKPDEDCSVGDVLLEANSLYVDLNEAINGGRVIEMELHAVAQVGFEKTERLRFLSDAYGTVCPVNLEKDSSQLCLSRGTQHLTAAAEEHIQVENERGEPVSVFADVLSFSDRGGKAEVSVAVNLLLRDSEGVYSAQQRVLSVEAASPEGGGELCGARVASINAERAGEEIVTDLSVVLDYSCAEFGEIDYLTSVELDSEHPYDLSALPSLTIVKAGSRDRWELAKIYHSRVDAIGELNAKYPLDGDLLLIPRA